MAFEAVCAALLLRLFWVTYPEGFARLSAVVAVVLLICWALTYSMSAKVRRNQSEKLERRARIFLVVAALLGVCGLVLGLIGGPHLGGVMFYGFAAQLLVLALGRAAIAI